MDSEVVVAVEEEEVSSAFWQQLHAYMENRFATSQISVAGGARVILSHPVRPPPPLFHHPPPFSEPLRQKDKIKSDVQTCPLHSFSISHLAFARQMWPRHVIQLLRLIRAGIFILMSDDSRFH